jgi:hypothetical protein
LWRKSWIQKKNSPVRRKTGGRKIIMRTREVRDDRKRKEKQPADYTS